MLTGSYLSRPYTEVERIFAVLELHRFALCKWSSASHIYGARLVASSGDSLHIVVASELFQYKMIRDLFSIDSFEPETRLSKLYIHSTVYYCEAVKPMDAYIRFVFTSWRVRRCRGPCH